MNSTVMWSKQSLYNPFIYIAGVRSLLLGGCALLLLSFVCYLSGTHYLGLVMPVFAKDATFPYYLSENLLHWLVLSILMFISGKIFSKSRIRLVDVLGTQALALLPFIILPILRLLPPFESFYIFSVYTIILFTLHVAAVIWSVALMFNAYKVTCNVRSDSRIISFIVTIFIAQILIICFIYYLKNNLQL
jgi:hypothetical protein